jgi:hypothetical protein
MISLHFGVPILGSLDYNIESATLSNSIAQILVILWNRKKCPFTSSGPA